MHPVPATDPLKDSRAVATSLFGRLDTFSQFAVKVAFISSLLLILATSVQADTQERSFETAMDHAEQRLRAHSFESAEMDFKDAQSLAGNNQERAHATLGLGRLYRLSGRPAEAIYQFATTMADDGLPANLRGRAALLKGHCLREGGQYIAAASAYHEAAETFESGTESRNHITARYYEALAYHQGGKLEIALEAYLSLAEMDQYPVLVDMLQPRIKRLKKELK